MSGPIAGDKPAFPGLSIEARTGLSKREYFAGLAMQGLFADPGTVGNSSEDMAKYAVKAADALLAELNKCPNA